MEKQTNDESINISPIDIIVDGAKRIWKKNAMIGDESEWHYYLAGYLHARGYEDIGVTDYPHPED